MRANALLMLLAGLLAGALLSATAYPSSDTRVFRGYTAQTSTVEAQWEQKFRDLPDVGVEC